MAAGIQDLYIEQGTDYSPFVSVTTDAVPPVAIPLTGYTARAKIRAYAQDATAVADFTCLMDTPNIGDITLKLTNAQTSAIPCDGVSYKNKTKYVWDLELISPAPALLVTRLYNGMVYVSPEVTK